MSDSDVRHLANEVSGALAQLPTEQLQQARVWLDEYALPTLDEISDGSQNPQLYEAIGLFHQARELIDDVLALSDNTRGRLVNYLATLGMSGDRPSPSLPHPSTLPRVPTDASRDRSWIDQVRERLPEHTGGQTTGLIYDQDGNEQILTSGRDQKLSDRIRLTLDTSSVYPPHRGDASPVVDTHVEAKYAQRMKEAGQTYGVVVLNNRMCPDPWGCHAAVRAILPRGSTLAVWEPGEIRPIEIRGEATP
ncbi:SCP1.201-like deaminase [Actinopolyspora lacussalsi subsp. righensis]|uniref:SCP1.201-like deaminase n=1 Tax=Actinopolyspora righensis TaxID=995060 RepID=A0A1I6YVS7_9ACTN|nr:DddA-like double-stranded DNA deaminase toxin [Actinopolyspora righensis]SFT54474.1 SCP1.201-like deaminase [Actinopolyspora righensis]